MVAAVKDAEEGGRENIENLGFSNWRGSGVVAVTSAKRYEGPLVGLGFRIEPDGAAAAGAGRAGYGASRLGAGGQTQGKTLGNAGGSGHGVGGGAA